MIVLNNKFVIDQNHFPDGTLRLSVLNCYPMQISWYYDNDEELITLIYLVKHLRNSPVGNPSQIPLFMPYVPNARMDRTEDGKNVFTLKYFAEIINGLNFEEVRIFDPHSTVTTALIDRAIVVAPFCLLRNAVDEMCRESSDENFTIFYPDAGSVKRYSGVIKNPYVFGNKVRDWDTGKIKGLDVIGDIERIKDHNILIIDDICSKGGTFYHSAKKLKELGAKDIYLYVTHCENTVLHGELIRSGLVKRIFTTDSIYTAEHELIKVVRRFRILNNEEVRVLD